jgi:hypothetical protein
VKRPYLVLLFVVVPAFAVALAGCVPVTATPVAGATFPAPAPAAGGQTYSDPFAYCAAVGTIDRPDARYSGPATPDAVVKQLMQTLEVTRTVSTSDFAAGTDWRCADGRVLGCWVGANLPCPEKANTSKTPTQAMSDFCSQEPSADGIPTAVTGHNVIYDWSCVNGKAVAGKQSVAVDAQGFIKDIWYPITRPQ